jgi:homoserine kinase
MSKIARTRTLKLALPATSANLGPAFDAAALALSLHLHIRARPAHEFTIIARGRDADVCGNPENHLVLTTYKEVLDSEHKPIQALALEIDNEIPIGKGLGSSAAARLAGIAMAVHFGGLRWNDSRIIAEAAVREHHPDNAAACWTGGLAVARMCGARDAVVATVTPKGKWPLLLAIPDEPLSTEQARRVLPASYSREDAVSNVQNSMLLLASFTQARTDLLKTALQDRFHQPYRSALCALLPRLEKLTGKQGIAGVALSGAGPSVLIFLEPKTSPGRAKAQVDAHLKRNGLRAEVIPAEITKAGARDSRGWKGGLRPVR